MVWIIVFNKISWKFYLVLISSKIYKVAVLMV